MNILPPPFPNRAEFPFVGTIKIQGLTVDIENLAGSVREGKGPGGKTWRTKMHYHYGEIRKTLGVDRDKLDVYIGPDPKSPKVFIVHQNHPGNHPKAGQYDEDKVMLGFNTAEAAKRAYLKQYNRKDFFRSMTEMTMSRFKKSIFGENKGEKVARIMRLAMSTEENICETPGEKIRSEGQGQGLARGKGKGPIGVPLKEKLREFAKSRKKDKQPSAFIREKMKTGSLQEAYEAGAKTALARAMSMPAITPKPMAAGGKVPNLSLKEALPGVSSGLSRGTLP